MMSNKIRWQRVRRRSIPLLLALIVLAFMLRRFEHSQVYHPDKTFRTSGAELGRPFQDVAFRTADGVSLNAWFYPANTNSPRKDFCVVVCHGNAGNIGDRLDLGSAYLTIGASVFLFDYRGYGRSQGVPSEEGTYRDAEAALQWLGQQGFPTTNLIIHGESLGGGVAAEVAVRHRVAGLVLQSTFTSIPDLGAELFPWLPVRWMSRIKYDTAAKLERLHVPVMIMHSRTDGLIGFHHAENNFARANEPKVLWEIIGDHNNGTADTPRFLEGCEKFLKIIESSRPAADPPAAATSLGR